MQLFSRCAKMRKYVGYEPLSPVLVLILNTLAITFHVCYWVQERKGLPLSPILRFIALLFKHTPTLKASTIRYLNCIQWNYPLLFVITNHFGASENQIVCMTQFKISQGMTRIQLLFNNKNNQHVYATTASSGEMDVHTYLTIYRPRGSSTANRPHSRT